MVRPLSASRHKGRHTVLHRQPLCRDRQVTCQPCLSLREPVLPSFSARFPRLEQDVGVVGLHGKQGSATGPAPAYLRGVLDGQEEADRTRGGGGRSIGIAVECKTPARANHQFCPHPQRPLLPTKPSSWHKHAHCYLFTSSRKTTCMGKARGPWCAMCGCARCTPSRWPCHKHTVYLAPAEKVMLPCSPSVLMACT